MCFGGGVCVGGDKIQEEEYKTREKKMRGVNLIENEASSTDNHMRIGVIAIRWNLYLCVCMHSFCI